MWSEPSTPRMGCRHTRSVRRGMMFTRRFLNLLQGRLALMKRGCVGLELIAANEREGVAVAGWGPAPRPGPGALSQGRLQP